MLLDHSVIKKMTQKKYWPLMENSISLSDRIGMSLFLLTSDKLTNGTKVLEFENKWSEWLGVNHSLYVSSGSTANYLLISAIKEYYGLKNGDKVVVPSTTWMTNVAPVFQTGLHPIFCDINLNNFSFDVEELKHISTVHPDIKVIFATHLIGFSSDIEKIREIFPKALILEDICESHGVEGPDGKKRGFNSVGSTFSFYFGHHMTTIEGGMVCTNDTELYELMRLKRSHGMAREASPDIFDKYAKENPDIDKTFLFITDGYNFRNHEICAVLGLSQLKRLDKNIQIRRSNYKHFHNKLCDIPSFFIPEYQEGNSSFSFPIITKNNNIEKIKQELQKNNIEYRPIISGNLLRHPAFKDYKLCTKNQNPNVEILHKNGVYVGNSQFVTTKKIDNLIQILNECTV